MIYLLKSEKKGFKREWKMIQITVLNEKITQMNVIL